jgi:hypothetical protein
LGEREAGEASLREAVRSNPQLASRLVVSLAAASRGPDVPAAQHGRKIRRVRAFERVATVASRKRVKKESEPGLINRPGLDRIAADRRPARG